MHFRDQLRYFRARHRVVADIGGDDLRGQFDVGAFTWIVGHGPDLCVDRPLKRRKS